MTLMGQGLTRKVIIGGIVSIICFGSAMFTYAEDNVCGSIEAEIQTAKIQKTINSSLYKALFGHYCDGTKNQDLATQLCDRSWANFTSSLAKQDLSRFFYDISRSCNKRKMPDLAVEYIEKAIFLSQQAGVSDQLVSYQNYWSQLLASKGETARAQNISRQRSARAQNQNSFQSIFEADYSSELTADERQNFYKKSIRSHLEKLLKKNKFVNIDPVLQEMLTIIEGMKVERLNNFFLEDCIVRGKQIVPSRNEAFLYPVMVDGNDVVNLLIKSDATRLFRTQLSKHQLQTKLKNFLRTIAKDGSTEALIKQQGAELYEVFLRPLEPHLASVDTLVVIPDIEMGLIPFEAFFDARVKEGNGYVINKKYAIAYLPGLSIHMKADKVRRSKGLNTLFAVLTDASDAVAGDLQTVASKVPVVKALKDEALTQGNLLHAANNYDVSIVHIASHASFDNKSEDSFIQLHNEQLKVDDFEKIVSSSALGFSPPELLILSACETSAGKGLTSNFGLAGVAAKSGIKSVVASLWKTRDTDILAGEKHSFYDYIKTNNTTKAAALKQAKLKFLRGEINASKEYWKPRNWAPFLLIGDWHAMSR